MIAMPKIFNYSEELLNLEEIWLEAQDRAQMSLVMMAQTLDQTKPVLATSKQLHVSMNHALKALIEIKSVNDGVVKGLLDIFKAGLKQHLEESTNGFVH